MEGCVLLPRPLNYASSHDALQLSIVMTMMMINEHTHTAALLTSDLFLDDVCFPCVCVRTRVESLLAHLFIV